MTTGRQVTIPALGHPSLEIRELDEQILIVSDQNYSLALQLIDNSRLVALNTGDITGAVPTPHFSAALDNIFARDGQLKSVAISAELAEKAHPELLHKIDPATGDYQCFRSGFYQDRTLWHWQNNGELSPEIWTENDQGVAHPLRQEQPAGTVYQRYDYQSDAVVSFRTIDPVADLDMFHEWMNQQRVAEFWEMNQSREELAEYLQKLLDDRRTWPLVGCFNDEPFGYMEVYWAMEDRIAPYYDCQPWDRGFHLLAGNHKYLGARYSRSWTRSISHFLFLDDPRTMRLVGEPRADNHRVMKLLSPAKWEFVKEFDFPHKRAALVSCHRRKFLEGIHL